MHVQVQEVDQRRQDRSLSGNGQLEQVHEGQGKERLLAEVVVVLEELFVEKEEEGAGIRWFTTITTTEKSDWLSRLR